MVLVGFVWGHRAGRVPAHHETAGSTDAELGTARLPLIGKRAWENALGECDRLVDKNVVNPHASILRHHVRRVQEAEDSGAQRP